MDAGFLIFLIAIGYFLPCTPNVRGPSVRAR